MLFFWLILVGQCLVACVCVSVCVCLCVGVCVCLCGCVCSLGAQAVSPGGTEVYRRAHTVLISIPVLYIKTSVGGNAAFRQRPRKSVHGDPDSSPSCTRESIPATVYIVARMRGFASRCRHEKPRLARRRDTPGPPGIRDTAGVGRP